MKPLVFDIYCGLGGWSEAFLAQGYRAIGFDIEAHDYGSGGYPGELVIADVRKLSGSDLVKQYGIPSCIVASPPCQEFSYMAMPWSKAKEKERKILADPKEQTRLTELFNECFRIQREVSDAAGRYIPIIIENVRGAQKWVGKARWAYGSFFLWGDVPALMPIPSKRIGGGVKAGDRNVGGVWTNSFDDSLKLAGNNGPRRWEDREVPRLCDALKVASDEGRRTDIGKGARFTSRDCGLEGIKQHGSGREWFAGDGKISRMTSSKSKSRKAASATIAKIPRPLAEWIAKVFKPTTK